MRSASRGCSQRILSVLHITRSFLAFHIRTPTSPCVQCRKLVFLHHSSCCAFTTPSASCQVARSATTPLQRCIALLYASIRRHRHKIVLLAERANPACSVLPSTSRQEMPFYAARGNTVLNHFPLLRSRTLLLCFYRYSASASITLKGVPPVSKTSLDSVSWDAHYLLLFEM